MSTINNKKLTNGCFYITIQRGDKMENKIGEYVKAYRLKKGLSLRAFGELCSMSHTHIDSIEKGVDVRTGRAVNLTAATVSKLANVMGVSEAELLGFDKKSEQKLSDAQLKFALFGTEDVPDSVLDEVRQYAQFLKIRERI